MSAKTQVARLLAEAGVGINGPHPYDLQVQDEAFYQKFLAKGTLGFGESYLDGDWTCPQLDWLIAKLLAAKLDRRIRLRPVLLWEAARAKYWNLQNRQRAHQVALEHYDLSNDFYQRLLGPSLAYTCAYWPEANEMDALAVSGEIAHLDRVDFARKNQELTEAQFRKYDLICRKLKLQPGMELLEMGCGWGGFAHHAAREFGVKVTALSISKEQVIFAKEYWQHQPGLEFHYCDFRDPHTYNPQGKRFDRVVSIGMAEHVGPKNYRHWFELVAQQLAPEGLFLLHTIGNEESQTQCDPFTQKYIFPNSVQPSLAQLAKAAEGLLIPEDLQNISKSYYFTLIGWYLNLHHHWGDIQGFLRPGVDPVRFLRHWDFYLLAGAAISLSKTGQLYQLVFSRTGNQQYYVGAR